MIIKHDTNNIIPVSSCCAYTVRLVFIIIRLSHVSHTVVIYSAHWHSLSLHLLWPTNSIEFHSLFGYHMVIATLAIKDVRVACWHQAITLINNDLSSNWTTSNKIQWICIKYGTVRSIRYCYRCRLTNSGHFRSGLHMLRVLSAVSPASRPGETSEYNKREMRHKWTMPCHHTC